MDSTSDRNLIKEENPLRNHIIWGNQDRKMSREE